VEDYDHNPSKQPTLTKENNKKQTQQLNIMTYNVRTLSSYERLLELEEAIKEIKYDVIGISEMRRLGNKIEEYENFIICHIGQTPGKHGVGFIIDKSLKRNIESFSGVTERVATLNINIKDYKLTIIQVYAPTDSASEREIEEFYKVIDKTMEISHKNIILMGDFNAKIGKPKQEEYLIMGKHGYGKRNERGQKLVDFALEHNLTIINTCFKKKENRRWTWISPNGLYKNEIDYILSNQPNLFQDITTLNLNYPSDHRPIRAKIKLAKEKLSRVKLITNQKMLLKNEEQKDMYNEILKQLLTDALKHKERIPIQTYYDKIIEAITKSLRQASKKTEQHKNHKIFTTRTIKLLQKRKELQNTKNKTRSMRNDLSALYKLVHKYIKQDYAQYQKETIEKHLHYTGSTKKAYKELRSNISWIEGLKKNDKNLFRRKDIITTATEFYKKLYSDNRQPINDSNIIITQKTDSVSYTKPIDENEVVEAINKLKLEKSPGADNITNEALKIAKVTLAKPLTELFNMILRRSETPSQWSKSNIILIYKKGDPKDIGNYRPISLLPCLYKLFSSLINTRISISLEAKQPIEQAGFRKGFSTIDHIHTLELIIEKYQEQQRPLYIAFIDYQKAFDTVSYTSIWKTMKEQEVEDIYINVIKSIYNNNIGRVKLETLGPCFNIERGVRQGDPLSPKLFIAILESIINKLNWSESGIKIQDTYLSHLRFADDLVLLSERDSQLQNMIESLHQASIRVGLEMNISKTMTMTNSIKRPITINSNPLEYTEHYIYLGKKISFDRKSNELEIERRIQLTWNKYWSLKSIFKSNMPINIKTKVMNSNLLPCLTYGCQTWKFTAKMKKRISTCQRGMERSMLKIKKMDKIQNIKIRKITKATNALNYAQKLKWKWAGHVARLDDERWTVRTTLWQGPQGKRTRGRPLTRWEDEIKKTAGPFWMQVAQERETWKCLEEAFTRSEDSC
jgi:hypothetical protein